MKKRINSTGRKTLTSEQIDIRVTTDHGEKHPSFMARFDFSALSGLDRNAKVYVEPYARSSSMRFDFGTLGSPSIPSDTTLSEIDISSSLLFRVKVVDESGHVGRILADANGIRPHDPEDDGPNRKSILPLKVTDLGEEIWRLAYDSHSGPVLEISNKIAGLAAKVKNDPLLQGSIYPHAFRALLRQFLIEETPDDELGWVGEWHVFLKALTGRDLSEHEFGDDEEEAEEFIEEAVRAFTSVNHFASLAGKYEEVQA